MKSKSKVLLVVLTAIFVCSAFPVTFAEAQPVEVWNVTWGGPGGDERRAVATAGDFVYMAGVIDGVDAFINKYDSDGNLLWNITDSRMSWGSATAATGDSVYLAGSNRSSDFVFSKAALAKYNSTDGGLIWNITWGKSGGVNGRAVAVTSDCVYLAGTTAVSDTANGSAFLVKYSDPAPIPTVTPVPTLTPTPTLATTAPIETPTAAPPAAPPTPPGFGGIRYRGTTCSGVSSNDKAEKLKPSFYFFARFCIKYSTTTNMNIAVKSPNPGILASATSFCSGVVV